MKKGLLAGTTALLTILGAMPLHAQGNATSADTPSEAGIGDIVVTAQFRGQRVQDTPIAITAVGEAMIRDKGLDRITDITDSAPNVVMKPSGSIYGPAAKRFGSISLPSSTTIKT